MSGSSLWPPAIDPGSGHPPQLRAFDSQLWLFDATDLTEPAVTWLEPGIPDDVLASPGAVDMTGPRWVNPTFEGWQ